MARFKLSVSLTLECEGKTPKTFRKQLEALCTSAIWTDADLNDFVLKATVDEVTRLKPCCGDGGGCPTCDPCSGPDCTGTRLHVHKPVSGAIRRWSL